MKIGVAAAASGNATATFIDRQGNHWIGKTTALAKAIPEVVAQRLASALLGPERAPTTLLADDGTVFSKKPTGSSSNLETFFSVPANLEGVSESAKSSIRDSFLDCLVFKIVTGDCDIIPDNFVIDIPNHVVLPIDGENAFPGTSIGDAEPTGIWTESEFNDFINDPAKFVNTMFDGQAGFLSEEIDKADLLDKFEKIANGIYGSGDYAMVQQVIGNTISDLVGFDELTKKLSNDTDLGKELDTHLRNIIPMITKSVEEIYGFTQAALHAT